MSALHVARFAIGLTVRVPHEALERHSASSPAAVGEALAEAVHAAVREQGLGYYPALDYFREAGGVDPELIAAADALAWLAATLVRNEVRTKLRPVFSTVNIQGLQAQAFALPPVRPSQPNALARLAAHYTPDTLKLDLRTSLIQRRPPAEGIERLAAHMACKWLKASFESIEVTSARREDEERSG